MKDFLGQELEIGDTGVMASHFSTFGVDVVFVAELIRFRVLGFAPGFIKVQEIQGLSSPISLTSEQAQSKLVKIV